MGTRATHSTATPVVPAAPRIPILHADNLPGEDDWAVLGSLRVDAEETFEHELQYDRYGSLMLAPAAFE
jgi:hypothetical protein